MPWYAAHRDLADPSFCRLALGVVYRALPVDDPRRRRPDIDLAARVLGWRPKVALDQGVERTIADFLAEAKAAARRPSKGAFVAASL